MDYEFDLTEIKESAYKDTRKEFKKVVDRIKGCQETSIVVFDKIDRYTRDSSSEEVRILKILYAPDRLRSISLLTVCLLVRIFGLGSFTLGIGSSSSILFGRNQRQRKASESAKAA